MGKIEQFYKNKKILITGNTGFKGTWLTLILNFFGCKNIYGISLKEEKNSIYSLLKKKLKIKTIYNDIRDKNVIELIKKLNPDIIFHFAAQPLVLNAYDDPIFTYETNIMGTVHICEAIKTIPKKISFINITTDKVYRNIETSKKYVETDYIGGYDPYSCSKSCSDLITSSYRKKIFKSNIRTSICRSGNVIGGGDFAMNRIIPDIYRSMIGNKRLIIRNPSSIRPYQHVLDTNYVYILIAMLQYNNNKFCGEYNIAPDDESIVTTEQLAKKCLKNNYEVKISYIKKDSIKESKILLLSNNKIKEIFNWHPIWNINEACKETMDWYQCLIDKQNVYLKSIEQIRKYNISFIERVKWDKQ